MKKLTYYSSSVLLIFAMACGGGEATDQMEEVPEEAMEAVEEAVQEMEEADDDEDNYSEREIKADEVPQNVMDALVAKYADASITEADELTDMEGNITYEIEIETGGTEKEVFFGADGTFIKEEMESEDDEEDEDGEE